MEGSFATPKSKAGGSPQPGAPKKGVNMLQAYNLFAPAEYRKLKAESPFLSPTEIRQVVGRRWAATPSDTKQKYADEAAAKNGSPQPSKELTSPPESTTRRSHSQISLRSDPAATTKVASPKSAKKMKTSDPTVSDSDSIDIDEFGDATPFKKVVFYYKEPKQLQAELKDAKEKLEKADASQAEVEDLKKQLAAQTERLTAAEKKINEKARLCLQKDVRIHRLLEELDKYKDAADTTDQLQAELKNVKGKLARAEASQAEVEGLKKQGTTRAEAEEKLKQRIVSLGKECQAKDQEIIRLGNEVTVLKRELLDCKAAAQQWEEAKQFFSKRQ